MYQVRRLSPGLCHTATASACASATATADACNNTCRMEQEEVPYSCEVVINRFHDKSPGLSVIEASIVVEKDSQQAIVIGKAGAKVKELGSVARTKLEEVRYPSPSGCDLLLMVDLGSVLFCSLVLCCLYSFSSDASI